MFETIVWATGGSPTADRGLPYVKELANKFGAKVIAAHSEEFLMGPRAGGQPVLYDEEEVQVKVKRQVRELTDAGIDASWALIGGPSLVGAAQMIADLARQAEADLIVVGTCGHTPLAGLLVGSVTQRLLHVARCAVMAVPSPRQPVDGSPDAKPATTATPAG
jgi:nucleotide-binding universal stress UspA family protein